MKLIYFDFTSFFSKFYPSVQVQAKEGMMGVVVVEIAYDFVVPCPKRHIRLGNLQNLVKSNGMIMDQTSWKSTKNGNITGKWSRIVVVLIGIVHVP